MVQTAQSAAALIGSASIGLSSMRSAGASTADDWFRVTAPAVTALLPLFETVKNRLPSMCGRAAFVNDGCLISYGASRLDSWRRAAIFVDKILKGTKPADLPVEQPTKFELVINLKAAKALGLTIPPVVMMRAQKVIKEASAKAGGR